MSHPRIPLTEQHPPRSSYLVQLLAEAHPGHCGLCDGRLPKRRRKWCGSPECLALYDYLYGVDNRAMKHGKR